MTTLLPKLVIDITVLPSTEQALNMYFKRSQYTVVYRTTPPFPKTLSRRPFPGPDTIQNRVSTTTLPRLSNDAGTTAFRVLAAISFCHLLNDMMQSVVPAVYPILKTSYHLDFSQIGMITASLQITASLLQPLVGTYTDAHPKPYSLAIGMGFTLTGLILLASAPTYIAILI